MIIDDPRVCLQVAPRTNKSEFINKYIYYELVVYTKGTYKLIERERVRCDPWRGSGQKKN